MAELKVKAPILTDSSSSARRSGAGRLLPTLLELIGATAAAEAILDKGTCVEGGLRSMPNDESK